MATERDGDGEKMCYRSEQSCRSLYCYAQQRLGQQ